MDPQQFQRRFETVAFTTAVPFADGSDGTDAVDHEGLARNLTAMADAGARLFIPCGNTGEYYALTDEERVAVVETHVDALADADGAHTVVAGAAGNVSELADLAAAYEGVGADALMVMHPDHTYAHADGLLEYYDAVCAATDLPVVIYKRGPTLPRSVLVAASQREQVVAVKFAVDDVDEFAATVEAADEAGGDVAWVTGIAERYAVPFAVEGAVGFTTGLGNFLPRETLALQDAIDAGDWERARTIQRALRPIEALREEPGPGSDIPNGNNVPVVKHGLDIAGLAGGPVRTPLVDLSERDRERLATCYEAVAGRFEPDTSA